MVNEESKSDVVQEARELLSKPYPPCDCGWKGCNGKTDLNGVRFCCELGQYSYEFHVDDEDVPNFARMRELLKSLCDEVEQLRSLNQTQERSIVAFQEQQKSYQRRLFDECVAANWDPEKRNTFAEEVAHLHEELSEAFRAWRRNKDCRTTVDENGKPQGVPIELADVLIGLFYNAELHGFDLFAAVEQKHQYNLTRNYVEEGRQLHVSAITPKRSPELAQREGEKS